MAGPYSPNDALIGPLLAATKSNILTNIPSIAAVYDQTPTKGLPDNTVALELKVGKIKTPTNGKMSMVTTFRARHSFRLANLADAQLRAQGYVYPWLQLLSAWPNQHPTSFTVIVTPTDVQMGQFADAGINSYTLLIGWEAVLEFNIPTS